MDPKTGRIYEVADDEEARQRGLVPIPPEDEQRVRGMNRHQRRKWAALQRRAAKKAVGVVYLDGKPIGRARDVRITYDTPAVVVAPDEVPRG